MNESPLQAVVMSRLAAPRQAGTQPPIKTSAYYLIQSLETLLPLGSVRLCKRRTTNPWNVRPRSRKPHGRSFTTSPRPSSLVVKSTFSLFLRRVLRRSTMPRGQQNSDSPRQGPVSCQSCRTQKLRCSRTQPCTNCVSRSITCAWEHPVLPASSTSTPSPSTNSDIIEQLERIESLLVSQRTETDTHRQCVDGQHSEQAIASQLLPHPTSSSPPNLHSGHVRTNKSPKPSYMWSPTVLSSPDVSGSPDTPKHKSCWKSSRPLHITYHASLGLHLFRPSLNRSMPT
jgi:hypothetical protein